MPYGGVIKGHPLGPLVTTAQRCTEVLQRSAVQGGIQRTMLEVLPTHNRSSAPASVPHAAQCARSFHYRPMFNIVTPQFSTTTVGSHSPRHPQTDTARRPARRARLDPTETHASHERTGTAGSNGSGLSLREISCVCRHLFRTGRRTTRTQCLFRHARSGGGN
eukprot:2821327-Prymnesium_polylepis.1